MAKFLDVYFHNKIVGQLIQDDHGNMNFIYAKKWLTNPKAVAISCSLPLQKEKFSKKQCRAFFEGLLPEQQQRKIIAKNLGVSEHNEFSLLEKIGGECAGALSFLPPEGKPHTSPTHYHELTDADLAKTLEELHTKPLLAGEYGVRLSLAGAQEKLAVYINDDRICIPLDNYPSTHILKPAHYIYGDIVFNEYFCMKLAKEIGLITAEVECKKVGEIAYLLVKRYDRFISSPQDGKQIIARLHQEDFCQALGFSSAQKYQNEEGPSLKNCFDLVRNQTIKPIVEINKILDAVIFNFLIGNCDAHGKNFSLLYQDGAQLAPLYDLVCTIYYDNLDKKMAMKLGGEYDINKIAFRHFDKFADEVQLSKSAVRHRIKSLIQAIIPSLSNIPIIDASQNNIAQLINRRCEHFKKLT